MMWSNRFFASNTSTSPSSDSKVHGRRVVSDDGRITWMNGCECWTFAALLVLKTQLSACFEYYSGRYHCVCEGDTFPIMDATGHVWVHDVVFLETKDGEDYIWEVAYEDSEILVWVKIIKDVDEHCWTNNPPLQISSGPIGGTDSRKCSVVQTNTGGSRPSGHPTWTPSDPRFNLQDILLLPSWAAIIAHFDAIGSPCSYTYDPDHIHIYHGLHSAEGACIAGPLSDPSVVICTGSY